MPTVIRHRRLPPHCLRGFEPLSCIVASRLPCSFGWLDISWYFGWRAVRSRSIARQFAVTGYVKNLPDGEVELVVEGRMEETRAMLRAVQVAMGRYICDVHETPSRATGGFSDFEVRF